MDLNDIGKDLTQAAKEAAKEFAKQAGKDTDAVRLAVDVAFQGILADLISGKPIEEVIAKHDTKTKALAAASLFKMSEQQSNAMSAMYDLLEKVLWIVIRSAITVV